MGWPASWPSRCFINGIHMGQVQADELNLQL